MITATYQIHFFFDLIEISFFFFPVKLPPVPSKAVSMMLVRSFSEEYKMKCCYKPELEGSLCGFDL